MEKEKRVPLTRNFVKRIKRKLLSSEPRKSKKIRQRYYSLLKKEQ